MKNKICLLLTILFFLGCTHESEIEVCDLASNYIEVTKKILENDIENSSQLIAKRDFLKKEILNRDISNIEINRLLISDEMNKNNCGLVIITINKIYSKAILINVVDSLDSDDSVYTNFLKLNYISNINGNISNDISHKIVNFFLNNNNNNNLLINGILLLPRLNDVRVKKIYMNFLRSESKTIKSITCSVLRRDKKNLNSVRAMFPIENFPCSGKN